MKKFSFIFSLFLLVQSSYCQSIRDELPLEEKIYGLSKIWQEVNYNFAFLDRLAFDFDSLYRAYVPKVIEAKDNFEYIHTLRRFMNHLEDGHTGIMYNQFYWNTGDYPPIFLKKEGDDFFVAEILQQYEAEIPIGSELLTADGTPYAEYKTMSPSGNLFGYLNTSVSLKFRTPEGKIVTKDFVRNFNHRYRSGDPPKMAEEENIEEEEWTEFSYTIKDNISLVEINTFQDDTVVSQFQASIDQINQTEALIIDVRENGGGNGAYAQEIAKHLMSSKELVTMSWRTRIHNAARKAWEQGDFKDNRAWEIHAPDTLHVGEEVQRITVPIVLLSSGQTFSAAEDFLIYCMSNPKIKRIGQPSAGSSGQPLFFDLPGGISARVCTKRDALPDGTDYIGIGIEPHIVIGEEEDALAVALEYVKK